MISLSRWALVPLAAATLALSLAGCAAPSPSTDATSSSSSEASGDQASTVSMRDGWVKAVESGMSAAFGVLVNDSDSDVRVVSSTSSASPIMELHETVENADGQMIMREKDGGFVIPAHSEYVLSPGANHLMLMEIAEPIRAGDTVDFAIEFEDGSTYEFSAPVKDYTGANETYVPDE